MIVEVKLEKPLSNIATIININNAKLIDKNRLLQTWGFGYETLYYSALQSPDSMRTIAIFPERKDITWQVGQTATFQALYGSYPYRELNQNLFHQIDTVNSYHLLEEKDLK